MSERSDKCPGGSHKLSKGFYRPLGTNLCLARWRLRLTTHGITMSAGTDGDDGTTSLIDVQIRDSDLKFVKVDLGEETAGGWYRELPDAQIEVLSRAHLERVPLIQADAETVAREKITEIVTRLSPIDGAETADPKASPR